MLFNRTGVRKLLRWSGTPSRSSENLSHVYRHIPSRIIRVQWSYLMIALDSSLGIRLCERLLLVVATAIRVSAEQVQQLLLLQVAVAFYQQQLEVLHFRSTWLALYLFLALLTLLHRSVKFCNVQNFQCLASTIRSDILSPFVHVFLG